MKYSRLWVLAAIIAFIILGGFVLSVPHARDGAKPVSQTAAPSVPTVTLHDVFKKGVHTITGSLLAPDACTAVQAAASLVGNDASNAGSIVIALSSSEDSGVCLQVPTRATFTTTITAPARLPIQATVNGVVATTTVS